MTTPPRMTTLGALIATRNALLRRGWSKRADRCLYTSLCHVVPDPLWSTVGHEAHAWLTQYLGEAIVVWNDRQADVADVLRALDDAIISLGGAGN